VKPVSTRFIIIISMLALVMGACGGGSTGSGGTAPGGAAAWQRVNTPFNHPSFIDFGANGHWFIADRGQGFHRSTDGGANWSAVNSGIATNFGWTINVLSSGDLVAGTFSNGGVNVNPVLFYRSSNEGATWAAIQSGQLDLSPAWTGCVTAANSNLGCGGYWAASPASGGWYSTNGGQSVTAATTTSSNGTTVFSLALNPVNHDLWMGTEQYGIFRSTNNGATWSAASPPDKTIDSVHGINDGNVFAITFDRNGNVLFGSQGGIWKSSNTGAGFAWTNVKGNSNTADGYALASANGTLYYGHKFDSSDPTSLYCSTNDGQTWTACDGGMPHSLEVRRLVVNPADKKMYAIAWDTTTDTGAVYSTANPVQ
jgi:hypothetical protein